MAEDRATRAERIRHLIETEGDAVAANTAVFNESRYEAFAELGSERHEELRTEARAIKEAAIERLPELLETVTDAVEGRGGHVHVAADAPAATDYVTEVCAAADAETVVKSKSMTTEEIEVNDALAAAGVEPVETDLGELVVQLAEEAPSHLIGPGIHKDREEIAALFNAHFEPDEPLETAAELTDFARDYLAGRIEAADVGMTGANFVAAESGTLCILTNEGNDRKVIEGTDVHVAVAGIEKLVPSVAEFAPFLDLVARSGTGQSQTAYTTLVSPPVDSPPVEADEREFHLVLVDNGRRAMREDEDLRETLYCVRCSACLNSCGNFQHVGGHAFGGETYTGGIAGGWEAGLEGHDAAAFNDLCTGCSRCVPQCPVKIDIPWLNTVVRDRLNREGVPRALDHVYRGLAADDEPAGLDAQKRLFGNFERLARLGSALAPLSNRIAATRPARALIERLFGVDRRRALPTFAGTTLRDWFEARDRAGPADFDRRAVLYPDAYTNYVDPGRGKAAVRLLEALGVAVEVPAVRSTGRAPLSQGMIETAGEHARAVADALEPAVAAGRDVVVVEPSDLAMVRGEYERLLPAERFEALADGSYEVMEYVYGLLEAGAPAEELRGPAGEAAVFYHSHCQQRTLGLEAHTVAVLEAAGYEVATSDVECCGMAGSFGYKTEYYDLAVALGEDLVDQRRRAPGRAVASGTSCQEQLASLTDERPPHPVELVAPE